MAVEIHSRFIPSKTPIFPDSSMPIDYPLLEHLFHRSPTISSFREMKNLILFAYILLIISSCEDKVDLKGKLKEGSSALVIDAFLSNAAQKQIIKISNTQFFYDNTSQKLLTGAVVKVKDLVKDTVYHFSETEKGIFTSDRNGDFAFKIGHSYSLTVEYNGVTYTSFTKMQRVTPIDSIKFIEAEKQNGDKIAGKYEAEFFATDFAGVGDRYWIRFYKNGIRNTDPSNIGVAYDAGSGNAAVTDGIVFILPLRRFIINNNDEKKKWVDGDEITVELYSVTNETADYISQLETQTNLDQGLFSQPQANLPTNILSTNAKENPVLGWFSVSAISKASTRVPLEYKK